MNIEMINPFDKFVMDFEGNTYPILNFYNDDGDIVKVDQATQCMFEANEMFYRLDISNYFEKVKLN